MMMIVIIMHLLEDTQMVVLIRGGALAPLPVTDVIVAQDRRHAVIFGSFQGPRQDHTLAAQVFPHRPVSLFHSRQRTSEPCL
jgi:hypothetical protein